MSWVITPAYLGAAVSDPDAQTYLRAVETADGQTLEPAVAVAVNSFVIGCKSDGIWTAIKASCILAGARTLNGALVPLVGAAPTNLGFLTTDYNRKLGINNTGSNTKRINTNRANNLDPQNSAHRAAYMSRMVGGDQIILATTTGTGNDAIDTGGGPVLSFKSRGGISSGISYTQSALNNTLLGINRSNASQMSYLINGSLTTISAASTTPAAETIGIGNRISAAAGNAANGTFAFYSLGESLSLALLNGRVTTLINAISAAIP